jgi:hypothetical protein
MPAFAKGDLKDEIDVVARFVWWKLNGHWPTEAETTKKK